MTKLKYYTCKRCTNKWKGRLGRRPLVCSKCKRYDWFKKEPHNEYHNQRRKIRSLASMKVQKAISDGKLPRVGRFNGQRNRIKCVDCKKEWATCYDHRDYAKPLQVDPVCTACNFKRGAGLIGIKTKKS